MCHYEIWDFNEKYQKMLYFADLKPLNVLKKQPDRIVFQLLDSNNLIFIFKNY